MVHLCVVFQLVPNSKSKLVKNLDHFLQGQMGPPVKNFIIGIVMNLHNG